jgi:hypothetical protein
VYRFLLTHASHAFKQDELVDAIDGPEEAIESSLNRLERRGFSSIVVGSGRLQIANSPSSPLASMVQ